MKALYIDYDYYYYPEGASNLQEFVAQIDKNYHSFIKLTQLSTENCVAPYFFEDETEDVYLNIGSIDIIAEKEITVLPRDEYNDRLRAVVQKKCPNCANFKEDCKDTEDLASYRDKLSLDGECWTFEGNE